MQFPIKGTRFFVPQIDCRGQFLFPINKYATKNGSICKYCETQIHVYLVRNLCAGMEDDMGSNFDDANVDKDLLSQIFSDGVDDSEDSLLDDGTDIMDSLKMDDGDNGMFAGDDLMKELEAELPVEASKKKKTKKAKPAEEEIVTLPKEPPVIEESVPADEPAPAVSEAAASVEPESEAPSIPRTGIPQDDSVSAEAQRVFDEERKTGTVTLITENTKITGSISSDGSLEVVGEITGDIECQGKVYVNGKVSGSIVASEIFVNTPWLEGGLQSSNVVKIGVGTNIIGDVVGNEAYIAGAVKGNIDVTGPVVVDSTAVIQGDIKAKSIQINAGAVISGHVSTNYADVDINEFFSKK